MIRLRADALPWRMVEDEVVALDTRSSRYLGTNPTGALLWQRLTTGATEAELVDELRAAHPDAGPTAARDVRAFLDDLRARGLVEES